MIRGPATHGQKFSISIDRVAIKKEEVREVLLCVEDFFRSPPFTYRSVSSDSGLTMLSEPVAIAESITPSPVYALWSQHMRARSSLICLLVGIGLCRVVALRKTPLSVDIMVAPLGVRQHQGEGENFRPR